MSIIPSSRPKQTLEQTLAILVAHGIDVSNRVALLGIRGYYGSMGTPGNNIDLYDDALFVISPDTYKTFNFNTDPSKQYGSNAAMICAGKYPFYRGDHHIGTPKAYKALRPYPEGVGIPCTRHGVRSTAHNTNIHKGGGNVTGSAGCQTIPPAQYVEAMLETIYPQMTKYGQKTTDYLLIEQDSAAASLPHPTADELSGQGSATQSNSEPQVVEQSPTLRRGSKGAYVVKLQKRLIELGYSLKADGDLGQATESIVKAFQRSKGLDADGIVGSDTWKALEDK